jgi:hypothetical protein
VIGTTDGEGGDEARLDGEIDAGRAVARGDDRLLRDERAAAEGVEHTDLGQVVDDGTDGVELGARRGFTVDDRLRRRAELGGLARRSTHCFGGLLASRERDRRDHARSTR